MKHKGPRPIVTTRELPPKVRQSEKGIQMLCPFCVPAHSIVPGQETACGTELKITAVQTIIPHRTVHDKGLKCIKCHEEGRDPMVRYMNGYVHVPDCTPGTRLLAQPPEFSKFAAQVFKLKDGRVKTWLEKRYGRVQQVQEIDALGEETGKVLGYFFLKV